MVIHERGVSSSTGVFMNIPINILRSLGQRGILDFGCVFQGVVVFLLCFQAFLKKIQAYLSRNTFVNTFYCKNKLKNEFLVSENIRIEVSFVVNGSFLVIFGNCQNCSAHFLAIFRLSAMRQRRWRQKILKKNQGSYFLCGNLYPEPRGQILKKRYYETPQPAPIKSVRAPPWRLCYSSVGGVR